MPFDTVVIPYVAALGLAVFVAVLTLRAENPKGSAIATLVLVAIGAAIAAYGCWFIAGRAGTTRALRYVLAYGGLLVPPLLVGLLRLRSDTGAAIGGEPGVVRTASRRGRRLYYSWLIWGAVGLFALIVAFVLSWADKH